MKFPWNQNWQKFDCFAGFEFWFLIKIQHWIFQNIYKNQYSRPIKLPVAKIHKFLHCAGLTFFDSPLNSSSVTFHTWNQIIQVKSSSRSKSPSYFGTLSVSLILIICPSSIDFCLMSKKKKSLEMKKKRLGENRKYGWIFFFQHSEIQLFVNSEK